jgi:hypothetical protein
MNPEGSVDAKIGVIGGCGCPNVVADDVMFPLGSIQGSCADLAGYTSVYDPMTNVQPSSVLTNTPVPMVGVTGASVMEMDDINNMENDNMPNKVPFGAYPGAETGGMGEPLPLDDYQFQYGPFPDVTTATGGASVMESISSGWTSLQDGVKGLFGMKSEDSWTTEMRKKWQEGVGGGGASATITGAAVAPKDEAAFQTWLSEIKKRYAAFRAGGQGRQGLTPRRGVLGAAAGESSAFSTLIWISVFIALAGLIYWKREAIMKMLPFGKKKEMAPPLPPLPPMQDADVMGMSAHRYRHAGAPKYRRYK